MLWIALLLARAGLVLSSKAPTLIIQSRHYQTSIYFRYSNTTITEMITNTGDKNRTLSLSYQLPDQAFVTKFSILPYGHFEYLGVLTEVTDSEQAARRKVNLDKSPRGGHQVQFSLEVPPNITIRVTLSYEELLRRKSGAYEHVMYVMPDRFTAELTTDVSVYDSAPITMTRLLTQPVGGGTVDWVNGSDIITYLSNNEVRVMYRVPLVDKQQAIIVYYDLLRNLDAGQVLISNGYFAHFFAPSGLTPLSKRIVLLLDCSGSMNDGIKDSQMKEAVGVIVENLNPRDQFALVFFDALVREKDSTSLLWVTPESISQSKTLVQNLKFSGGTNLDDALQTVLGLLNQYPGAPTETPAPAIIVLLTDGVPTNGETNLHEIAKKFRFYNHMKASLISIGLGEDIDFDFLSKISLQNNGYGKRIHVESDLKQSLKEVLETISTPVLTQLQFDYFPNSPVNDSAFTPRVFTVYFNGSEISVAGKVPENARNFVAQVSCHSSNGYMELKGRTRTSGATYRIGEHHRTERTWAFLSVRHALQNMMTAVTLEDFMAAKDQVIHLSKKYNFLMPVTTMTAETPYGEITLRISSDHSFDFQRTVHYNHRYQEHGVNSGHTDGMSTFHNGSFVDSDPHFAVEVRGLDRHVCFDVYGQPGDIYDLISDHSTGVYVNVLVEAPERYNHSRKHLPTYITQAAVLCNDSVVVAELAAFSITSRLANLTLPWKTDTFVTDDVLINVTSPARATISIGSDIMLVILRHVLPGRQVDRMNHLGVYIADGRGFSRTTGGLLGQFQDTEGEIESQLDRDSVHLKLSSRSRKQKYKVLAQAGQRLNEDTSQLIPCWMVKHNMRDLLQWRKHAYGRRYLLETR